MDIYEIRRRNLKAVLDAQFDGKAKQLADRMGKDGSQIARYIKPRGGKPENIGPGVARQIETSIKKPEGWLDRLHANQVQEESPYYHTLNHEEMQDIADEKAFAFLDLWEEMSQRKLSPSKKRDLYKLIRDAYLQRLIAGRTIPGDQTELKEDIEQYQNIIKITSNNGS